MSSLTSVPVTGAAAQVRAVRQLPRAWLAPNTASATRAGHASRWVLVRKAEAIRLPTGSCRRLPTLVLADRKTAARSLRGSSVYAISAAQTAARYSHEKAYLVSADCFPWAGMPDRLRQQG